MNDLLEIRQEGRFIRIIINGQLQSKECKNEKEAKRLALKLNNRILKEIPGSKQQNRRAEK